MDKKSIQDIEVGGKRVFCRVDFNVPMVEGQVTDDTRIRASLPTLRYLMDRGAKVIVAAHLGRPRGQVVESLRMSPVARCLGKHLGKRIIYVDQVVGQKVECAVEQLQEGDVLLLENVRFEQGEEKNDPALAKAYAQLAEIFVNDAFGTMHRAHASTVGVAAFLPSVAGLLVQKELDVFSKALAHPKRPFTAIVGGAKVWDKIQMISHLLSRVDNLLIGGGFSCTFLRAKGFEIGKSLLEEDQIGVAKEIMEVAKEKGVTLHIPVDVVCAKELSPNAKATIVEVDKVPEDQAIFDIGPRTREIFSEAIHSSGLVIWNGPMGVFETTPFSQGTHAVAQALASSTAQTIVGGGDSVAAIQQMGFGSQISHLSTGGGASLKLLEGKELPGVSVLCDMELT